MVKKITPKLMRTTISLFLLAVLAAAGTGCTTVRHRLILNDDYQPTPGAQFAVGPVTNGCGKVFGVDVEQRFAAALTKELRKSDLLWDPAHSAAPRIDVATEIVYYEKGNAFQRWLAPGNGSTFLIVRCDFQENGKTIATEDAKKVVFAGGGYTIGAWRYVISDVADDVVDDIEKRFRKNKR